MSFKKKCSNPNPWNAALFRNKLFADAEDENILDLIWALHPMTDVLIRQRRGSPEKEQRGRSVRQQPRFALHSINQEMPAIPSSRRLEETRGTASVSAPPEQTNPDNTLIFNFSKIIFKNIYFPITVDIQHYISIRGTG